MGGCWSSEAGRPSRTEKSNSSRVESPRRSCDFIRHWWGYWFNANRPDAYDHEQMRLAAIERGRSKIHEYQKEAEIYQNSDRDTFKEFEMIFEKNISELENNIVKITSLNDFYGKYENKIDVENGKIIGIDNYQYANCKAKFHFSEIIFNQLCLTMEYLDMEMSKFNLKCWYSNTISNEKTKKTAELFFPEERDKDGKIKEGQKIFKAGSDGFIALAGTPTGQSKFYLLAQHPEIFKDKKVTSITVIRHSDSTIDINYEFGSQLDQQKEASSNASP